MLNFILVAIFIVCQFYSVELLLLRSFEKKYTNCWKVLPTMFLLNKVMNAKQTCRFLLPLGFCIQISTIEQKGSDGVDEASLS